MATRSSRPAALTEVISLIDALPEPRIVLDGDYRIVHANPAYCREYGTGTPVVGRKCYEVSHHIDVPCDQAGEACPLRDSRSAGVSQRVLHLHHTPRGEEHVDVETTPIKDRSGRTSYFVETLKTVRHARSRVAAHGLVGRSAAFNQMLELVVRAAPTDIAVLLLGETGTGKELVARAIHEASRRASGPFVAVDCAGLTETLFESELFGYEKGAFTGANFRKIGLVEAASGGTLFLDEIGDMPLSQQVKLLRLLETGTFRRVGSVEMLGADFRLVCATHRDLQAMVREGSFRRDFYFRISAFPVHTPALRERPEDIALLAESLLARVAPRAGLRLSAEAQQVLSRMPFPGNIRELRNVIERACVLATSDVILPAHLPPMDDASVQAPAAAPAIEAKAGPVGEEIVPLDEAERRYVRWAAQRFAGDRRTLAGRLGISERTLFRKLRE
jgi:two-component system response regulator HydG